MLVWALAASYIHAYTCRCSLIFGFGRLKKLVVAVGPLPSPLIAGLFHLLKLPRLNSLTCHLPDTLNLAFKLKRKKFTIEVSGGACVLTYMTYSLHPPRNSTFPQTSPALPTGHSKMAVTRQPIATLTPSVRNTMWTSEH